MMGSEVRGYDELTQLNIHHSTQLHIFYQVSIFTHSPEPEPQLERPGKPQAEIEVGDDRKVPVAVGAAQTPRRAEPRTSTKHAQRSIIQSWS